MFIVSYTVSLKRGQIHPWPTSAHTRLLWLGSGRCGVTEVLDNVVSCVVSDDTGKQSAIP